MASQKLILTRYVAEQGWNLFSIYVDDGDEVEVADIEIEKLDEPILVYNLEVEDFHTYFVGEYGVLVHNYISNQQFILG